MAHDDDSFENSLGVVLGRALRQQLDPETRRRHLDSLTTQAMRLRDEQPVAEVVALRRPQRMALVAAVVTMVVFSATAVLSASQRALPGDLLYSLKRGAEEARLLLAVSPEADAAVRAEIASNRAEEMQLLAARQGADAGPQLAQLEQQARESIAAAQEAAPGEVSVNEATAQAEQSIENAREIIRADVPTPSPSPTASTPPVAVGPPETTTAPVDPTPTEEPTGLPPIIPGSGGGQPIPSDQNP
jgi:Domain of unknown function (DUF5667)